MGICDECKEYKYTLPMKDLMDANVSIVFPHVRLLCSDCCKEIKQRVLKHPGRWVRE